MYQGEPWGVEGIGLLHRAAVQGCQQGCRLLPPSGSIPPNMGQAGTRGLWMCTRSPPTATASTPARNSTYATCVLPCCPSRLCEDDREPREHHQRAHLQGRPDGHGLGALRALWMGCTSQPVTVCIALAMQC